VTQLEEVNQPEHERNPGNYAEPDEYR
jgi:hypothetical protein